MRSSFFGCCFALAAGAATLAPLAAQPATAAAVAPAPIGIDSCALLTNTYFPGPGFIRNANMRWVTTAGLKISFHNRATQHVTGIRFQVNYRGDVETIDDVGNFTPGVQIAHTYSQFVDFAYLGTRPNYCRVVSVKYADGTIWSTEGRRQSH
jgi:hypothetical protein